MSALLFVFRGLPASGKSAIASAMLGAGLIDVVVCRDNIRVEFGCAGDAWTQESERKVQDERDRKILDALSKGLRVASSDTNLSDGVIRHLQRLAAQHNAPVVIVDVCAPVDLCIERDAQRTGIAHVGADVIRKMWGRL